MYNPIIVEHFSNPRNIGSLEKKDYVIKVGNPVCDDRIEMHVCLDEHKKITHVKYMAYGCATSIATASIFSEYVKGKTPADLKKTPYEEKVNMLGELEPNQKHCQDILIKLFSNFNDV